MSERLPSGGRTLSVIPSTREGQAASRADSEAPTPVINPATSPDTPASAQPASQGVAPATGQSTDAHHDQITSPDSAADGERIHTLNGTPVLPFSFAKRHGVILTDWEGDRLAVSCRETVSAEALLELQRCFRCHLTLSTVTDAVFDTVLQRSYEHREGGTAAAMAGLDEDLDLARLAEQLPQTEDLLETQDDAPVIRLINALLGQAIRDEASDIHIEPFEDHVRVRFRIDGVLREVLRPQRVLAPLVASRIKVMAKLDIAEKRLPQDGRISLRIAGRAVDVRVSTLPSGHGERVVLRLLDKQAGRLDLAQLGMAPEACARMTRLITRPHGILLVTGPTGSGKTTTLYAALTQINQGRSNIMTVEDPIEYHLDGIGQTQVNTRVDMSFARGLRAILRQDPDVVMVGEIRDLDTVQIAVQASLTGHLVLSTLHTNTAVGAITRLRDMGVEPFLLSSSLIGVLAQRLVRLLCAECKQAKIPDAAERAVLGFAADEEPEARIYEPVGCAACGHTGYRGRTGIYELVEIDTPLRALIHEGASEHALEARARQHSPALRADGLRRVRKGETALEEVLRVSSEE